MSKTSQRPFLIYNQKVGHNTVYGYIIQQSYKRKQYWLAGKPSKPFRWGRGLVSQV